jgi:pimeloyl-ACP methyl ester carboxylesterase
LKLLRRIVAVIVLLVAAAALSFWLRPVEYLNQLTYLREYFSGIENHSAQVDGYRVHYLVDGPANGPVVVLIHGLGARAEDWSNLAPYFVNAGFRVYIPDLPGYGRSEKPANFSYSVPDEARVVVSFIDALGLKQVDLGGWSMGGWIVQIVAHDHPERINRLMLFDSAGLNLKPAWDTRLFTPATKSDLDQLETLLFIHTIKATDFVTRDILRNSNQNAWIIRRAMDSMLAGHDVTDNLLPQLKMPVLIVWGDQDRIVPLREGQQMHALIPDSTLEVIPGCGHMAPEQCPSRIAPQMLQFLQQ